MTTLRGILIVVIATSASLVLGLFATQGVRPAQANAQALNIVVYGPASGVAAFVNKATGFGHNVTVFSAAQWSAASVATFQSFDVIGVPTILPGDSAALLASSVTLGSAIDGNIVISGLHADQHFDAGATLYLENALAFAGAVRGTGLLSVTDCDQNPYAWLPQTGPFVGVTAVACTNINPITITDPGHPVMAGLTDAALSNWQQSLHTYFPTVGGFTVIAVGSGSGAPTNSPAVLVAEAERCFAIDAINDQFSVINDGASADLLVLGNDECSNDTPISVVVQTGDLLPDRGGSATTDGATLSYTPAAGFVGFEEFTYTAQDAGLEGGVDPPAVDQDTATVVVNVLEDLTPNAVDDVATTLQTQAVIIDVLANDSLGNAPNEVTIETPPANGSATLQADDTIQYVPNITSIGEDTFEYRLTDANGDSDVATVTVGVFFVNGQVPIDIMPNSDGNNINLRAGQGAGIDVAILSVGEFFDAPNEIDPLTLKFGPREANIWGSPQVRDVDGDGDDDLLVTFLMQQTGIPCGATHAILFGRTFNFQPISGMDTINTFNCPRIRKRH